MSRMLGAKHPPDKLTWTERVELCPGPPRSAFALMTTLPTQPCMAGCGRATAGLVCNKCRKERRVS